MNLLIRTPRELQKEELTQQVETARVQARAYLAQTDWMVVRFAETGVPVPPVVLKERAAARLKL